MTIIYIIYYLQTYRTLITISLIFQARICFRLLMKRYSLEMQEKGYLLISHLARHYEVESNAPVGGHHEYLLAGHMV